MPGTVVSCQERGRQVVALKSARRKISECTGIDESFRLRDMPVHGQPLFTSVSAKRLLGKEGLGLCQNRPRSLERVGEALPVME